MIPAKHNIYGNLKNGALKKMGRVISGRVSLVKYANENPEARTVKSTSKINASPIKSFGRKCRGMPCQSSIVCLYVRMHHSSKTLTLSKAPGVMNMDGVVVRTPAEQPVQIIEYHHIPWFEFLTLVEPYCTPEISLFVHSYPLICVSRISSQSDSDEHTLNLSFTI